MRFIRQEETQRRDDYSAREILYVLWSRKTVVVGAVLAMLAAATLFSFSREPVYTAEAVVSILPRQQEQNQAEREAFLEEVFTVVADDELVGQASREAGWRSEAEFRERLEPELFASQERSGIIVRFHGSNPELAADAADAYAMLFVERVQQLNERRLAGGTLAADASIDSQAAAPSFQSSPRPLLYALIAAGIGILVGGGAALLLEGRASSWRDARDAEMTLKAPVVGVIPDYSVFEEEKS